MGVVVATAVAITAWVAVEGLWRPAHVVYLVPLPLLVANVLVRARAGSLVARLDRT